MILILCDVYFIYFFFAVTNLPPGVEMFIEIKPYKNSIVGDPFTIPLRTVGVPDETLNLTATLMKEKGTSVQLAWSPPLGDRYKNKTIEYEVHYTAVVHRQMPEELVNGKLLPISTDIIII